MFGRRSDGHRLDHIDPIVQFMPYIMKTRNDAMNLIALDADYDPLAEYIKKRTKEGHKISFMALIVTAYVRTVAEYPALNRFIMNKQVFARNSIDVSLAVLRNAKDKQKQDEALVKMNFAPDATLDEVNARIDEKVLEAANEDEANGTVDFASKLIHMRLLVQVVVALAKLLDRYGLLPKALYDISPFHCGMFITNMASIGMPALYHHLYNLGNTTMFIAMGKAERRPVPTKEGFAFKNVLPLKVVTDERVCGGASYAQGMHYFQKLIAHPEMLETKPERVNYDYDFKTHTEKKN